jgi:hypothetical protein
MSREPIAATAHYLIDPRCFRTRSPRAFARESRCLRHVRLSGHVRSAWGSTSRCAILRDFRNWHE